MSVELKFSLLFHVLLDIIVMNDFTVWLLKLSGLWYILNGYDSKLMHIMCTVFIISMCQGIYLPAEIYKLITSYENFQQTMEQFGFVLTHILASLKIINLYISRAEISQIVNDLFSNYGRNNVATYEQCSSLQRKFHKKIRRITFFFFLLGNCTSLIRVFISLVYLMYCKNEFYYKDVCSSIQPLLIPLPERFEGTIFEWLVCGFQGLCQTMYAWQIVAYDTLFISFLMRIDCNIYILHYIFETIHMRSTYKIQKQVGKHCEAQLVHQMNNEMELATKKLERLIRMTKKVSNVFQYLILLQAIFALFVLMSCLYVAASVPVLSGTFIYQIEYYLTITIQLSLYCWFANDITISFSKIPQAIYNNVWIFANKRYKRSMLINMIRMNMPIYLTIGGFIPLNLNVLIYIVRASYSYFAVIKNK